MSSIKSRGKRGGGRAGNAGRRGSSSILQMPWKLTTNIDKPTEPLNEEGVKAIHLGAMEILEDIGLEILNGEARDILAKAGCTVVGENVKFDREFIMEMINKAPSEFDITPRNPEKKITVGGKKNIVWECFFTAELLGHKNTSKSARNQRDMQKFT